MLQQSRSDLESHENILNESHKALRSMTWFGRVQNFLTGKDPSQNQPYNKNENPPESSIVYKERPIEKNNNNKDKNIVDIGIIAEQIYDLSKTLNNIIDDQNKNIHNMK